MNARQEFILPLIEPFAADWVFDFLHKRALCGIERVLGHSYQRRVGGGESWLSVRYEPGALHVDLPPGGSVRKLSSRVARLFDADHDPANVEAQLGRDPRLGHLVRAAPGLRVPGAWDGFETAVRAILGQQVSVARATVLANRIVEAYGGGAFPDAAALARSEPAELGMPGRRGRAITGLAQAVERGEIDLEGLPDAVALQAKLLKIEGIGPWTAGYIAMRVARDPDAFLPTDWVVRKQLDAKAPTLAGLGEAWRPWRAYAVMYLWWEAGRAQAISY